MATTQVGTGGLTVGGLVTAAEALISTKPTGSIVTNVQSTEQCDTERIDDGDGAKHTTLVFGKTTTATVDVIGKTVANVVGARVAALNYMTTARTTTYGKGAIQVSDSLLSVPAAT